MIDVDLINEKSLPAPDASQFETWLAGLVKHHQIDGQVCIKIVDATESQSLNHTYRNKNSPTNVLSFPSEVPAFVGSDHLGDLAICAPVVEREAAKQGKALSDHWAHLTIHGVLHLLGYDHINDDEALEMETIEIRCLKSMGINNPYEM